jgi:hypothetical protein
MAKAKGKASGFAQLKKNSRKKDRLESLSKKAESGNKTSYVDDRFWVPTREKSGNATATIRFLDSPAGEDEPYILYYQHGFQIGARWLIENCPTSIGKDCPICAANQELWATDTKQNKAIVSERKRKLNYVANIFVVDDPMNPENNGKVFLYRYGAKIHEKIKIAMNPEFEDEKPFIPFDFWEGADFKLRVTGKGRDTNYDQSKFLTPKPFMEGDDAQIEAIWAKEYKLQQFLDPKEYDEYDVLLGKFNKIVGNDSDSVKRKIDSEEETEHSKPSTIEDEESAEATDVDDLPESFTTPEYDEEDEPVVEDEEGEGDIDDYLANLANNA